MKLNEKNKKIKFKALMYNNGGGKENVLNGREEGITC